MTNHKLIAIMGFLGGLLATVVVAAAQDAPTGGQPWDLSNRAQAGQLTFYDAPRGATATGQPLDAGDLDGNGCGDIAVAGANDSFPMPEGFRINAGHVRVVMNICAISGEHDMGAADGPGFEVVTFLGARSEDVAGSEVYLADFNGDGYDDLLFGAQNGDGAQGGRTNAGAVYLVPGGPDFGAREDVDLLDPPPDMLVFHGPAEDTRLGIWVQGGDVDGDGFEDMLMGANQGDGIDGARPNAGEVWVLYGAADLLGTYGPVVDLQFPPRDFTRILGADPDDLFGSTVHGADLNADGFADIIASAALWRGSAGIGGLNFGGGDGPANARFNSGDTFVIFGNPALRGRIIDLRTLLDPAGAPRDTSLTVIYGAEANDLLGEEIFAGDLNGDGRNELVLGTLVSRGETNNDEEAGETWVLLTDDSFEGRMLDLSRVASQRAVVIYQDQAFSKWGDTLHVGDLDGDGFEDLLIGGPDYDAAGYDGLPDSNAGIVTVIFGAEGSGLPVTEFGSIQVFAPPDGLRLRFIVGADVNDMIGYGLGMYDMDGDGALDIVVNGMGGDGPDNQRFDSGEFVIISGAEFMAPGHEFE